MFRASRIKRLLDNLLLNHVNVFRELLQYFNRQSILYSTSTNMTEDIKFDDLKSLSRLNVYMKDNKAVIQKVNNIIRCGTENLQFVVDFDFTLTKQREEGAAMLDSWSIFEKSEQLPHSLRKEIDSLKDKYLPIELDKTSPIDRKVQAQKQWMEDEHKLLIGLKFDRGEIEELVRKYGHSLRDRTMELFTNLNKHNVPILVFSAGVGDVVETHLRQQEVLLDNVKIISNFLAYEGNKLIGLKNHENVIHVYNKNETSINHEYFKLVQARKNVILMGDSLGDASMTDGLENTENVLKIGFLSDETKLPAYREIFDIVLVDDQTMDVVLDILGFIL